MRILFRRPYGFPALIRLLFFLLLLYSIYVWLITALFYSYLSGGFLKGGFHETIQNKVGILFTLFFVLDSFCLLSILIGIVIKRYIVTISITGSILAIASTIIAWMQYKIIPSMYWWEPFLSGGGYIMTVLLFYVSFKTMEDNSDDQAQ